MCLENRTARRKEEQTWGARRHCNPQTHLSPEFLPWGARLLCQLALSREETEGKTLYWRSEPLGLLSALLCLGGCKDTAKVEVLRKNFSLSFLFNLFYWPRVDLQCSTNLCHTAKWSVIHRDALFFIFYFTVVYNRMLTIVPCALL